MQTAHDGVDLYESSRCTVDNVRAHHFGRDGLHIWGNRTSGEIPIMTAFPLLNVSLDPDDLAGTDTTSNRTVIFNNAVLNSSFNWNCRTGLAWAGCSGLTVTNCEMNYNAAGRFASDTKSGLDIEGPGGPMRVRHGVFTNCSFLHNAVHGILAYNGACIGQQDFKFINCTVKAGEYGDAVWPENRDMEFHDCDIYGSVVHLFEQAENIPRDADFDLLFHRTNFHEEDEQWSYLPLDTAGWSTNCTNGPHKFDLVAPLGKTASVIFDSCGFYTNCLGIVRLLGRETTEFYPSCAPCEHCQDSLSYTCPPNSCLPPGQFNGQPNSTQDARYIRATNCYFKNTGRIRCTDTTQVLAVEHTVVENMVVDIPSTVRDSSDPIDTYNTDFGGWSTSWGLSCLPEYCSDVDTIYSPYPVFPPCLPFFTLPDSIHDLRWQQCDPNGMNYPVQACVSDATCYAQIVIPDSALSSTLTSPMSGTVDIQGLFTVDQDFTFDSAQVKMEPGAEIAVQSGATLYLNNSTVSSCLGVMWKSITVHAGGVLKIVGSFVDDAENAVNALDSSIVFLDGNQFHNNRVVVQVPFQSNAPVYNVSIYAVNNTMYSAGTMPVPYPGQTTTVGAQGYAAFDVDRISLDLSAGPNLIHNMSNGIVAFQSDLYVTQTTFLHIQPDSAYAHYANGSGIYARSPKGFHYAKVIGFGTGTNADPSFEDCNWGVYTEYMSVYSYDNFMLDVGTAYRVDRSGYMHVDIQNNRLDTRRDGMVLNMNDGAAQVLVQYNDITFARNPSPTQAFKGYYAIRVNEANTLNTNSQILNNSIHYRQGASTAYGGISLMSANKWRVAGNTLQMTNNSYNRVGVHMGGCKEVEVTCNDIHGANNGYPELGQAAIRNWMGTAPLISCNRVDKTTNGALFSGPGLDVELRGNEFNNHQYGLHLELYTVIGPQDWRGNLWNVPIPAPGLGAWNENTLSAINNQIKYDSGQPSNVPNSYAPLTWFQIEAGNTFTCYEGVGECVGYKSRCDSCLKEIYEQIANDSIENGIYTTETRWTLQGDLYNVLKGAPVLLQDADMAAFYAAVQNTVAGQLKDLDDDRLVLFSLDSTVLAQLQQNRDQLLLLQGELKTAISQLHATGLTTAQVNALESTVSGLQQSISNLVAYNTAASDLAVNSRVLAAENVKNANAGIGATALTETNYKTVNAIYLSTIAKNVEGFTEQQVEDLFAVANQCPLLGGNAVFQARALYYLVDPEQEFDDPALCLQQGLITKSLKAPQESSISMVPNPAGDMVTLLLQTPFEQGGQVVFYSAVGASVLNLRIPADQQSTVINTSVLAPGLYHYTVISDGTVQGDGKLSIAR